MFDFCCRFIEQHFQKYDTKKIESMDQALDVQAVNVSQGMVKVAVDLGEMVNKQADLGGSILGIAEEG